MANQNRDMTEMFETVSNNLTSTFGAKGITIDSFGYRDGNVYENPAIQQGVDSQFQRMQQLEEVQANATRQAVINTQNLDTAYAQATQTAIIAQSEAQAQQLLSDVLNTNPGLIQYEYASRWNGQLPQIMGQSNALPMIPFALSTPEPSQLPQPSGTPVPLGQPGQ
ncbi:MAG: hypothetical protein M3Q81_01895 [bacterium]|nr:hypothetical protein [bacterium]